eukprot:1015359-Pyramimonas_sp.AAC.1
MTPHENPLPWRELASPWDTGTRGAADLLAGVDLEGHPPGSSPDLLRSRELGAGRILLTLR